MIPDFRNVVLFFLPRFGFCFRQWSNAVFRMSCFGARVSRDGADMQADRCYFRLKQVQAYYTSYHILVFTIHICIFALKLFPIETTFFLQILLYATVVLTHSATTRNSKVLGRKCCIRYKHSSIFIAGLNVTSIPNLR
jgi:hypothetical protein